MRDYIEGAFEALSWVRSLIKGSKMRCRTCRRVLEEIEETLEEMQTGVAIDFRHRITVSWFI